MIVGASGSMPATWENRIEFQASSFRLAPSQLCRHLEPGPADETFFLLLLYLPMSVCRTESLSNK